VVTPRLHEGPRTFKSRRDGVAPSRDHHGRQTRPAGRNRRGLKTTGRRMPYPLGRQAQKNMRLPSI
jgi:hypothetical protein